MFGKFKFNNSDELQDYLNKQVQETISISDLESMIEGHTKELELIRDVTQIGILTKINDELMPPSKKCDADYVLKLSEALSYIERKE